MVKKFELYKESLLNNLRGPSEDEILNENPDLFLKISIENDNVDGVKKALDYGADPLSNNCYLFVLCDNEEIKTLLFEYTNLPKSIDDFIRILFKNIKLNNPYQSDTERYSNEYGVLFYISGKYMEISSEIYYIFYNVYLKSKAEIHKLFIDYFNLDNNTLHVVNFSSFKLNKMLFDNKQLKESLLNKIEGPSEEEVIKNLLKRPRNLLLISAEKNISSGIKKAFELRKKYKEDTIDEAIFYCAQYDSLEALIELLNNMEGKYDVELYKKYALKNAITYKSYGILKYLISIGTIIPPSIDIEKIDDDEIYLLLHTKQEIKESLLNKLEGPSEEEVISNLKSMEPTKELMMSIEYGLLDNVIDAVDRGADLSSSVLQYLEINNQSVNYYMSPIEYAIYLDKEDIFNYLLTFYKKNINIHILETAIELKKIKYVDKLLEAGFNPSEVSYDVLKNINSDELYILLKKYYDKYNKR